MNYSQGNEPTTNQKHQGTQNATSSKDTQGVLHETQRIQKAFDETEQATRQGLDVPAPILTFEDTKAQGTHKSQDTQGTHKPQGTPSKHVTKRKTYKTQDEEYTDSTQLNTEEQKQAFYTAFEKGVLTPQYDRKGNLYFNPRGLVTLADVINTLADPTKELIYYSVDKVSDRFDFFNNGYNQLLENDPRLRNVFTRGDLFLPVNRSVLTYILHGFNYEVNDKTLQPRSDKFVTRQHLATLSTLLQGE